MEAARDEMWGPLVCPKPRRIGHASVVSDPIRSLRWQSCHQMDPADLVGIFLTKGGELQLDPTPPFICGSPPTRSSNPVVHDARFGEFDPNPISVAAPVPASASGLTGCARAKYGFAPAAVRIEGFDCLDRGRRRSRGISAVA